MADLIVETNLTDPDRVYTSIIDAHRDFSDAESSEFNARLILILANHIGDAEVIRQALTLAAKDLQAEDA